MPGTAGSKYGFYDVPVCGDGKVFKYRKQMKKELSSFGTKRPKSARIPRLPFRKLIRITRDKR